jgi:HSP20 family molecular chaperone IbpA
MVVDLAVSEQERNIEMEKNNYLDLLTSVDVMNTINGGKTEPIIKLSQTQNYREIRVRIPGIDSEIIEVEVNDNLVAIYYMMSVQSADKLVKLPYSVYNRKQPYFIDVSNIKAQVEADELVVKLPFNQLANGYHKKIRTRED